MTRQVYGKSTIVTLKYDSSWEPLDWAKEYCRSYINNDAGIDNDGKYFINYYFSDEEDATYFSLKWI